MWWWWWLLPWCTQAVLINVTVTSGQREYDPLDQVIPLLPEPYTLHALNECPPHQNQSIVHIVGEETSRQVAVSCGQIAIPFPAPTQSRFEIAVDDCVLTMTCLSLRTIEAEFVKLILFQPLLIHPQREDVRVTVRVDTAYYAQSKTLTVVNLGECQNPMTDGPPTCGNLPPDWPGDPWSQAEPTTYNASHLVDAQWRRYPAVENTWVSAVTAIGPWRMGLKENLNMNIPGIQYNLTSSLREMVQHCGVDVEERDQTIDHHFNVSLFLLTEDGVRDCNSNPYLIRLNREVHAVIAHDVSNGIGVQIVSASYEECPCDETFAQRDANLYPCTTQAYRLVVVLVLDVPQKQEIYEGVRFQEDIVSAGLSEQCFGFPRERAWTVERHGDYVRTTLTLKSACMSLGEEPDCNRFNRCHADRRHVSDYSLYFNLHQCLELQCLLEGSDCECSDQPPDDLPVQLDIQLYECPTELMTEDLEFEPLVHAFAGTQHPTGKFRPMESASYHFHDRAVIGLETLGMGVRIRDLYLCLLQDSTWEQCIVSGQSCPEGIDAGCNVEDWRVYCAEEGCVVPIETRYVVMEHYETYNDVYFDSRPCKERACGECPWDIQGETTTMDAVSFQCDYLLPNQQKQAQWILDITGIVLTCQGTGTRSLQRPRVVQTLTIENDVDPPKEETTSKGEAHPSWAWRSDLSFAWMDGLCFLLLFLVGVHCFKSRERNS